MKLVSIAITLVFYPAFLPGAAAKVMVRPHVTTFRIEQVRVEAQQFRELSSRLEAASLCQAEVAAKLQASLAGANLARIQSKAVQLQSSVATEERDAQKEKEIARKKAEEEQKKLQEEACIKKQQAENAKKMQEVRTFDLVSGRKIRSVWRKIHESVDPFLAEFRECERYKQWRDFPLDAWEEGETFIVACVQECKNALSESVSAGEKLCKWIGELQRTEEYMSTSGDAGSLLRAKVDAFYTFSYCGYYREKIISLQHNLRCILSRIGAIKKSLA